MINLDNGQYIRLTPNPVTDKVLLNYHLTSMGTVTLQVINVQGKICRVFNKLASGAELLMTGLPGVVYFAKIALPGKHQHYIIRLFKL